MNRHPRWTLVLLCLTVIASSACTRSEDQAATTPVDSQSKQKPIADPRTGANPSAQNNNRDRSADEGGFEEPKAIKYNAGSILSQRGFRFRVTDPQTLRVTPVSPIAEVALFGAPAALTVRIGQAITGKTSAIGPGGVATLSDLKRNGGYDVYFIAKSDASGLTLFMVPTGSRPALPSGFTHISEAVWFIYKDQSGIRDFVDLGGGRCRYYGELNIDPKWHRFQASVKPGYGPIPVKDLVPAGATTALLHLNVFIDRNAAANSFVHFFFRSRLGLLKTLRPIAGLAQPQIYPVEVEVPLFRASRDKPLYYQFSANFTSSPNNYLVVNVMGWEMPRANGD